MKDIVEPCGGAPGGRLGEAASIVAGGLRRPALAPIGIACAAGCIDLPVYAVALWFAQYAALPGFAPLTAAGLAVIGAVLAVGLLAVGGGYAPRVLRRAGAAVLRAALALGAPVVIGVMTLTDGADVAFPVVATAIAIAVAAAVIPSRVAGAVAVRWAIETGLTQRRAVIAGGGEHAVHLIRGLAALPGNDVHLYGIFDDRDDIRSPIQVLGVPKIGSYEDLVAFVRRSEIDMVIVALPLTAERRIDWLLKQFRVLPVEVRLSAFSRDYAFARDGSFIRDGLRDGHGPLIGALRRSFAPERRLTKRAFDLLFGTVALVVLSPVMAAAALAIRLETPGPVLFRQRRHGYNDRVIEVLKFRTMHTAAADPDAQRIVTRDDPRVTRVGRFLRRSSIDELPQLVNVLRGELSLVGPRPHALDAMSSGRERFTQILDGYSARHRLPPGITGWAQIHGWRGEIDDPAKLHARFEHDLYYIENWSLWLDLMVLLRTPLSLLDTRSAY